MPTSALPRRWRGGWREETNIAAIAGRRVLIDPLVQGHSQSAHAENLIGDDGDQAEQEDADDHDLQPKDDSTNQDHSSISL